MYIRNILSNHDYSKLMSHKNFNDNHIEKIIDSDNVGAQSAFLNHSDNKVKNHHIDRLLTKSHKIKSELATHRDLKDYHIDKLLDDKEKDYAPHLSMRKDLKVHHVDKILNTSEAKGYKSTALTLLNKNLKKHHLDKLKNDSDKEVSRLAKIFLDKHY